MSKQVGIRKCKQQKSQEMLEDGPCLVPQINPLFVEEVLEIVLQFIKGQNNALLLGNYRLVCKFWDREISKMIRRDTFINLKTILLPYPDGMGWTAARKKISFRYKVPYPEVRSFENIKLTFNRGMKFPIEEKKLTKWFEVMGSEVKAIRFVSTLDKKDTNCYKILERILKEWCPNLQNLHLDGVLYFESLIFASRFTDATKGVICKKLKEVKIRVKWNDGYKWKNRRKIPTILTKVRNFNDMIYTHGLPGSSAEFTEYSNRRGVKATVPSELIKKSEFPDISQFIPENFFPKRLDGGILGQIIGSTLVEKFSLVGSTHDMNMRNLAAFFHYRKNCWRSSLKHFELNMVLQKNISRDLIVFGKLKYPLVTLKVEQDFRAKHSNSTIGNLTRFVSYFAETLQHLEYSGAFNLMNDQAINFMLPVLPKLKTFVYNNSCDYELCPINILTNLPHLKKLHLTVSSTIKVGTSFFETKTGNLASEQLNELKIIGSLSGTRGRKLLQWFPNVKRVELTVLDTDDGIRSLIGDLGNLEVDHLSLTWSRTNGQVRGTQSNTALICEVNKLKNLKYLEMKFGHSNFPCCVTLSAFSEGFGALTQLRALKLTNFGVYREDHPEIIKCIAFIPVKQFVNLSFHCSSSTRARKRHDNNPN